MNFRTCLPLIVGVLLCVLSSAAAQKPVRPPEPARCVQERFRVPFNESALRQRRFSAVFECYRPRGALSMEVTARAIVKKLEDKCHYCGECGLDEVRLYFGRWPRPPRIEVHPAIDVYRGGRYRVFARRFGRDCARMRRYLGVRKRVYRPRGRTAARFRRRLCELIDLARKIRDFWCKDINTGPFFYPPNPEHPMATVVTFMESLAYYYNGK